MKSEELERPDAFLRLIRRAQRGKLKIYLGYCAGVGKTYQMLQEAHRLRADGIDVVVGYVETHNRAETAALLNGLEIIPKQKTLYRGIELEEMNLDAVLQRKPSVVLVDELAHTNVPGSKYGKRYQDVQEILHAGIHVISTLNVQHLESLYDMVERSLGVKVRERIPDSVVAEADQLVNVDVTMEDLRKRLEEGKIYPRERIATALGNFFTSKNLQELRELTLRELASQLDLRRRESDDEQIPSTPDQVMACLSSRSPNSEAILRYASRLAGRLNRNWYAVYVQTPSEKPDVIDAQTQRLLSNTLTLAKQLGAIVFTYKGSDIVDTILQFAQEYRVGHIVVGTPTRPMPIWKRVLGKRSLTESLVQKATNLTVVVLDTRRRQTPPEIASELITGSDKMVPAATPESKSIMRLSDFLSPEDILVVEEPLTRHEVLKRLVERLCARAGITSVQDALDAVVLREGKASTFFNSGAAFPHVRLSGISKAFVALALTKGGVSDVGAQKPIRLVFLFICPENQPGLHLQLLALTAKAAQNHRLFQNLEEAHTAEEAALQIHEWESAPVGTNGH